MPVTIHRTAAAALHDHPPGSGHKAPSLSPKPEYSMTISDRHIPLSQRATPKVPIAPQNPRVAGVRSALADMQPDQTSRPAIPASVLLLRHPGSSAERRRRPSRSPMDADNASDPGMKRIENPAPEVFVPALAAWPAAQPRPAPPAMLSLAPGPTLN